jgi:hypothetical protein
MAIGIPVNPSGPHRRSDLPAHLSQECRSSAKHVGIPRQSYANEAVAPAPIVPEEMIAGQDIYAVFIENPLQLDSGQRIIDPKPSHARKTALTRRQEGSFNAFVQSLTIRADDRSNMCQIVLLREPDELVQQPDADGRNV